MAVRTTLGVAAVAALAAAAGPAAAGPVEDPVIAVKGLIGHGGACTTARPKLVAVQDNVVSIALPPMQVRVGPAGDGAPVPDGRATCSVNFRVVPPSGHDFVLRQAAWRGEVDLAAGTTAYREVNYLLPGFAGEYVPARGEFAGPLTQAWTATDELPPPGNPPQGQSVSLDVALGARAAADAGAGAVRWVTGEDGATVVLTFAVRPVGGRG